MYLQQKAPRNSSGKQLKTVRRQQTAIKSSRNNAQYVSFQAFIPERYKKVFSELILYKAELRVGYLSLVERFYYIDTGRIVHHVYAVSVHSETDLFTGEVIHFQY